MDYCATHFGEKLKDLTFQDIETFFMTQRSETDQLEFKSIDPVKNLRDQLPKIQEGVCAFLNSSGGLLIWGAPRGHKISGLKEKVFTGTLTAFTTILEHDSLVSLISDAITPLPVGIRVNILENNGSCVVVIEIDTSPYSPHQTGNSYYMRMDGQSRPAPHHYVEALMKKIRYPNIESLFKVKATDYTFINNPRITAHKVTIEVYFFNWSPLQNEENLYFNILTDHGRFSDHAYNKQHVRNDGRQFRRTDVIPVLYFGEPFKQSKDLLYDPSMLPEDKKSKIYISFGGKHSPLKGAEYTLDFSNYPPPTPAGLITEKIENKLKLELMEIKGSTKESIIQSYLNR